MKKSILIICSVLTSFSLMAFAFINWNDSFGDQKESSRSKIIVFDQDLINIIAKPADPELAYNLDSRFMRTITKEDLVKAKSIYDISPEDSRFIVSYYSVSLSILDENYKTVKIETGDSPTLTDAQLKLLHSVDYSTDILIRADYQEKNNVTGVLEDSYTTPHLTVVPEKQAVCFSGKDALIAYVKENTKEFKNIVKANKLQPGKVSFTVNKEGKVADARLLSTSGYPDYDKRMLELVNSLPSNWMPATNSKGEEVEQTFVFSFGSIGC